MTQIREDPSYMITGDSTATVQVTANQIRTISIEETVINIDEGGTATITLIAMTTLLLII